MGICEYKKKVREQLDEIMEKPVTLGRMEEAGIMAGLLYSLDALHGEHTETFTEADARAWVARMENADGSTGGHWTQDQTAAAARSVAGKEENTAAYLTACDQLGTAPADALMVGDSLANDVQGARTAGLHALHLDRAGDGDLRSLSALREVLPRQAS